MFHLIYPRYLVSWVHTEPMSQLSKPANMDSDSEPEEKSEDAKQIDAINRRLQAQKIEAEKTGEIDKLQETQKRESAKRQQRRQVQRQASSGGHPDLQDLDFGSIPSSRNQTLPEPMRPTEGRDSYDGLVIHISHRLIHSAW